MPRRGRNSPPEILYIRKTQALSPKELFGSHETHSGISYLGSELRHTYIGDPLDALRDNIAVGRDETEGRDRGKEHLDVFREAGRDPKGTNPTSIPDKPGPGKSTTRQLYFDMEQVLTTLKASLRKITQKMTRNL
jgi:hypothetical protein